MRRPPIFATTVALAAALAGPPLLVLVSRRVFGDSTTLAINASLQTVYCGLAAFVIWIVRRREQLPLESIGIRRPNGSTVLSAVLLWAAIFYALPVLTAPLRNLVGSGDLQMGMQNLARLPIWFRVIVGATGGIVEEILYRGYAIERLAALSGRRWLGATLAALAFGFAHVPAWGLGFALAADLPFGIVMTVFYVWRRDLVANMLVHSCALTLAMLTRV